MPSEAAMTAVAIRDETSAVMLTNQQLTMIANTSFVPAAFRGKVPEVLACVATGRALGLPDMTSLRGIHVIEGKATLSAELMVAIVRGHGHSITGTVDDKKAVVKGKRSDNGDAMDASFTLEMAAAAGLVNKNNWKKHPDDMMWARAVSKLCRRLFADCFAGATYVAEEVEPTADELLDEDWTTAGGVTKPGQTEESEVTNGQSARDPADGGTDSDTADTSSRPGFATPWAQLKKLAADAGIPRDVLADVGGQMFPGRAPSTLSEDETVALWNAVGERVEAGVDA